MIIKASASAEIRQLVEALGASDEVRREAAIARLAIAGPRAVDRLVAAYATADEPETRIAILRALEPIADPRGAAVGRQAIAHGSDEAVAGIATLRALLDTPHAPAAAEALDALVSVALDGSADRRVRLAAADALQDLPEPIRSRIAEALRHEGGDARTSVAAEATWQDAIEGRLPQDPTVLSDVVRQHATSAPLSTLRQLLEQIRTRETTARSSSRRAGWRTLRGTMHQAVALRGSRIALYDLRETLEEATGPLPVTFLAALHVIGDESCLAPLAAAYAGSAEHPVWRSRVREAFRAIVKREKITRRHALVKRIAAKCPDIL